MTLKSTNHRTGSRRARPMRMNALGLVLVLVVPLATARADSYTLESAAITTGGDTLADPNVGGGGGLAVTGELAIGVMTVSGCTLEAGIVPCLLPDCILTLSVINGSYGTVEVDPNQPFYEPNQAVTLTATPISGKSFNEWTIYDPNYPGDPNYATYDSNTTITVVMNADRQVDAMFRCGSGTEQMLPMIAVGLVVVGFASRKVWWRN